MNAVEGRQLGKLYREWVRLQARIEATADDSPRLRHLLDREIELGDRIIAAKPSNPNEGAMRIVVEAVNGLVDIEPTLLERCRCIAAATCAATPVGSFWENLRYRAYLATDLMLVRRLSRDNWPAAGCLDTEIGCFNGIGVFHGETEVQPRVQA